MSHHAHDHGHHTEKSTKTKKSPGFWKKGGIAEFIASMVLPLTVFPAITLVLTSLIPIWAGVLVVFASGLAGYLLLFHHWEVALKKNKKWHSLHHGVYILKIFLLPFGLIEIVLYKLFGREILGAIMYLVMCLPTFITTFLFYVLGAIVVIISIRLTVKFFRSDPLPPPELNGVRYKSAD